MLKYLEQEGVKFQYNTIVKNVEFNTQGGKKRAVRLICSVNGKAENVDIGSDELVFITLGSNTEQSGFGDQTHPAVAPDGIGPAWELWENIAAQSDDFGNPQKFCGDRAGSNWESATITCFDDKIPAYIAKLTGRDPYN